MVHALGVRPALAAITVAVISLAATIATAGEPGAKSSSVRPNAPSRGAHVVNLDPQALVGRATAGATAPARPTLPAPCIDTPVDRFYRARNDEPAWLTRSGSVRRRTLGLLEQIEHADEDALDPQRYDVVGLKMALSEQVHVQSASAADVHALDARITAAALNYAHDLAGGRVSPARAEIAGQRSKPGVDTVAVLQQGIESGDVRRALSELAPPHEGYKRLRAALPRYRTLAAAGGWPRVERQDKVEPGKRYPAEVLESIRRRLAAEKFWGESVVQVRMPTATSAAAKGSAASARNTLVYDGALVDAVRRFQGAHGVAADGVIGAKTLAELNRSADDVVHTIEANMERWRWLPRDLGRRHIQADIPSFELSAYDDDHVSLAMRLIAGEKEWPSPLFSDQVEYVVLNPNWHVPKRIAAEEILPRVIEDPAYLSKNDIALVSHEGRVLQPYDLDIVPLLLEDFPYRLRQAPGPRNPLGRVKFVMPNGYDVYLHDTPNDALFARTNRALSHGCIRLEKPVELADWILSADQSWTHEKVVEQIGTDERHTVKLNAPVPVHLTYFTAFVDDEGRLELRPDVYGIDEKLSRFLEPSKIAARASGIATP
jgi:murein L,D-transpeptidase YcbB/YkuD